MHLLINSNVVIDFIGRRQPYYDAAKLLFQLIAVQEFIASISVSMLTDIHYILARDYGSVAAQEMLEDKLEYLQLVGVDPEDAHKALAARWPDFEDCLVAQCAQKIGADYIVTRNTADFTQSAVPAITPEGLFEHLEQQGFSYDLCDI